MAEKRVSVRLVAALQPVRHIVERAGGAGYL
jgi:hypothetical protein